MQEHGFDTLAKSVAHPPPRRQLLRLVGGGGLAALAVRGDVPVVVQGGPCSFSFTGTVRTGPSASQSITNGAAAGVLHGELTFTAGQYGGITQGQIAVTNGPTVPVVGQVNARAINLRLTMNEHQIVVAVGTSAQDLSTCHGAVDGLLTGPQVGDLGDWHLPDVRSSEAR